MSTVFSDDLSVVPWYVWLILAVVLFCQSFWLFNDAQKRGAAKWFWGLWGLIQVPCPTLLYLLIVRKIWKPVIKKLRSKT